MPGRDRVRQASLLSDLLEQPGRHPAPEDHVEQPQRPAPSVRARDPLGSVDEVRLLDVAFVHDETPRHRRRRPGRADRARRCARAEGRVDEVHHLRVVHLAGGGHDDVVPGVVPVEEAGDRLARHLLDRAGKALHAPAQRMVGPDRFVEDVKDDVVGRVLVHRDLFQHDRALGLNVVRRERRVLNQVADRAERQPEVLAQRARVEARELARRERVDVAPDRVERLSDLQRAPRRRAFEEQVLEEMGRAVQVGGFVPRSRPNPRTDRNGTGSLEPLAHDTHARRENRPVVPHAVPRTLRFLIRLRHRPRGPGGASGPGPCHHVRDPGRDRGRRLRAVSARDRRSARWSPG